MSLEIEINQAINQLYYTEYLIAEETNEETIKELEKNRKDILRKINKLTEALEKARALKEEIFI